MSEPVWKHGDIKLILRDNHTWNVENIELEECCNVVELHADIVVDD